MDTNSSKPAATIRNEYDLLKIELQANLKRQEMALKDKQETKKLKMEENKIKEELKLKKQEIVMKARQPASSK